MSDQQTHPPAPAGDHGSVASAQPTAEDVELQQLDLSALQAPSQPSPAPQSTTQATGSSQPGDALAAVAAAADQHHQHRENTFDKDSDLSQLLPTLGQSPAPSSVSQGKATPALLIRFPNLKLASYDVYFHRRLEPASVRTGILPSSRGHVPHDLCASRQRPRQHSSLLPARSVASHVQHRRLCVPRHGSGGTPTPPGVLLWWWRSRRQHRLVSCRHSHPASAAATPAAALQSRPVEHPSAVQSGCRVLGVPPVPALVYVRWTELPCSRQWQWCAPLQSCLVHGTPGLMTVFSLSQLQHTTTTCSRRPTTKSAALRHGS